MPDGLSISGAAAIQSQVYITTLAKSLQLEKDTAAQLLQLLPGSGGEEGTSRGPQVSGLGETLDRFA
jgi:hypothetical protein